MAEPKLPDISAQETALLYSKLNKYNQGRASFKEAGAYMVVLPQAGKPYYTLWLYSPLTERQTILYICELSAEIHEALRIASTMLYYSKRCIFIVPYNEKRMRSNGDDLIFFGKYRGHFLHEILKIDPAYISWIAYKFTPQIPKQERFVKIAQAYHSVHLDLMTRRAKEMPRTSNYLGETGEKVTDLQLKVMRTRLEDDPYKTKFDGNIPQFFVKQILTLTDIHGNLAVIVVHSQFPSSQSGILSGREHAYRPGEIVYIASARVLRRYESYGKRYTRLSHVKFARM